MNFKFVLLPNRDDKMIFKYNFTKGVGSESQNTMETRWSSMVVIEDFA